MNDQTENAVPVTDDPDDTARTWPRSHPKFRLAESLVAFVTEADARLPRDQFLRLVIDRIVDELSAPLGT